MEKTIIDAGWANGWSPEEEEKYNKIIKELREDPTTKMTGKSLGNCMSETTWENDKYKITWKVDSSD